MKSRTIGLAEPITGIQGQQLNLCALGQLRWLVDDQPAGVDMRPDGHVHEIITTRFAQQGVAADPGAVRLSRSR